ncbi:hypothetical protein V2G26_020331 [Clonostachys chloroleuca]
MLVAHVHDQVQGVIVYLLSWNTIASSQPTPTPAPGPSKYNTHALPIIYRREYESTRQNNIAHAFGGLSLEPTTRVCTFNVKRDKGNISAKSRKKMSKMKIGGYKKSVTRNEEMPVGG